MPIYGLERARDNGVLGPNFRPSTDDCTGQTPRVVEGRPRCGVMVSQASTSASLRGGAAFGDIVRLLGDFLDRPLVDRTGLSGAYDLELQFTADRGSLPGAVPGGVSAAGGDIPSVFTAVQEQLGLKLTPQSGTAAVLVIDRVSPPSEN